MSKAKSDPYGDEMVVPNMGKAKPETRTHEERILTALETIRDDQRELIAYQKNLIKLIETKKK